ncbi:HAMP domain-containing sensor histidine kinase [Chryseobacterium sp.]|uniref:HAMP domain-containing sensor histidine kinase n=1 Tax=Chryseobacterium sp. TaxID=1871047 RepID=UPI001B1B0B36|nr:HAMP domain-containing sensor histidine kinase [Chryseobacterium sp.]MBO9691112.1 HAMP domain-containing histidine kinase [Chryseobacterium sp.]
MKLKSRLSLVFTVLFAVLLIFVLTSIYLIVKRDWRNNFLKQLEDRAYTVGHNYLAQDNFTKLEFDQVLKKLPRTLPKETIRIYNLNFQPVFIKDSSTTWNRKTLQKVVKNKIIYYQQGDIYVVGIYYVDNSGDYIVMAEAQNKLGEKSLKELRETMIYCFLIAILITVLLGHWFSGVSLRPIDRINKYMNKIQAKSLNTRIPVKRKRDEIGILTQSINNLLERLQESFDSQQAFVSHASHELKTPITSLIGNTEIALGKTRTPEDYQDILKGVLRDSLHMNNIISDLLTFDQLDHRNYPLEAVSLETFIWKVTDYSSKTIPDLKFNINIQNPEYFQETYINANSNLLELALTNIISNAHKFSGKEILILISIEDTFVQFSITDYGIGINAEELDKITMPFYRSANAYGIKGFGLGLSLCAKIIKLHQGNLKFLSKINEGTTVTVEVPVI